MTDSAQFIVKYSLLTTPIIIILLQFLTFPPIHSLYLSKHKTFSLTTKAIQSDCHAMCYCIHSVFHSRIWYSRAVALIYFHFFWRKHTSIVYAISEMGQIHILRNSCTRASNILNHVVVAVEEFTF